MLVTKCDICKKEIKSYKEEIGVRPPTGFVNYVFCLKCGKPVVKFLEKNHLGEKDKK
jgi:DNA-directed RNA polymerase subunit RPC12/RpoP